MRTASKNLLAVGSITLAGAAIALGSALPAQASTSVLPGDHGIAAGVVKVPESFEHLEIPGSPADWTVTAPAHTKFVEQDRLAIERAERGKSFSDYSDHIATEACSLSDDARSLTCAMSATGDASLKKGDRLRISAVVVVDDGAPVGEQRASSKLAIASGERNAELALTLGVPVGDPTPPAPVVTGITGEGDDRVIRGKAVPGASVDVVDSKGTAIGSTHVDQHGRWSVLAGHAAEGSLQVTQRVGEHESEPATARAAAAEDRATTGTPTGAVVAAVIGGVVVLGGAAAALVLRTKRAARRS